MKRDCLVYSINWYPVLFSSLPSKLRMTTSPPTEPSSSPVQNEAASVSDRVKPGELIGFGLGGLPYNLGVDAVKQLANPIYNIVLGVNPALVGVILMATRIWDACTDPVMGWVSDNTRTRWGRRRPFIALGALLSALFFPLIWFVPRGADEAAASLYFGVTALLFYTGFTIYCVPYVTLALEMSPNYNERTRVFAVRSIFGSLAGLVIAWAFRAAHWEGFVDTVQGVRVVGIGIGLLFFLAGICPAIFARERYMKIARNQVRQKFATSFKRTFKNKDFRILIGLTTMIVMGTFTFNALGVYVNTYYIFGGDVKQAATLMGLGGTVGMLCNWCYLPIMTMLAARIGKIRALRISLSMGFVASNAKWFLFRPEWPYAQLALPLLMAPAGTGFWLLVNSMKADVCDLDEWETGIRREGAYAAISSWTQKFAAALTFSLTGLLLVGIGFEQSRGGDQSASTLLMMRLGFSVFPALVFAAGLWMLRYYKLSPERVAEIRHDLEQRRDRV